VTDNNKTAEKEATSCEGKHPEIPFRLTSGTYVYGTFYGKI